MSALERWVQQNLASILLWLLAGGFVMVVAELALTSHTDGLQLVGIGASVIGLLLTLAALAVGRSARYAVAVALLVLSVTGLMGTLQHAQNQPDAATLTPAAVTRPVAMRAQEEDENKPAPPPLAPLSLSGLSLMAAVATLGSGRPRP